MSFSESEKLVDDKISWYNGFTILKGLATDLQRVFINIFNKIGSDQ